MHYDAFGLFEAPSPLSLARSVNQVAGRFFSSLHSVGKEVLGITGTIVHDLGRNIIPIPILKDIPMILGYLIAHQSMEGYVASYDEEHSKIEHFGSILRDNIFHMVANGMMNRLSEARKLAAQCAEAYNDECGILIYQATHGFMQDLCEVVLEKMGVYTNQVANLEKGIRMAIARAGGPGEGHYVTVDAHSRGAQTTANALAAFNANEKAMLWVSTYGGANIIQNEGLLGGTNYISRKDPIPFLADPFTYVRALFGGIPNVRFMQSQEFGFDHGATGNTYRTAMNLNSKEFYRRVGIK